VQHGSCRVDPPSNNRVVNPGPISEERLDFLPMPQEVAREMKYRVRDRPMMDEEINIPSNVKASAYRDGRESLPEIAEKRRACVFDNRFIRNGH
jgi:hypothetical protein